MEWTSRSKRQKNTRNDTIEQAKAAREARARAKREQRPALVITKAIRRQAHVNTFRKSCAERCTKKAADIAKTETTPRRREEALRAAGRARGAFVKRRGARGRRPRHQSARSHHQRRGPRGRYRRRRVAAEGPRGAVLARRPLAQRNEVLIDAVGALLNRRDDVDLHALILDDDGALRVAIRGRRGPFLEAAVAAAASAARRLGDEALFARRLWPTNIVEVAGEAGKKALVGDGASKALRAMIEEGPLAESGDADVDAHARILGTLGCLGRRLLSAKHADARAFADAVSVSTQAHGERRRFIHGR